MFLSFLCLPAYARESIRTQWIQIDHLKSTHHFLTKSKATEITKAIEKWSKFNGIDPDWITAIYSIESHFDPNAVDPNGKGGGIPQIQCETAQCVVNNKHDAYKVTLQELIRCPGLSIRLSCRHFSDLLVAFNGDYVKATRAYNAGSNNVIRGHFKGRKPSVPGMSYMSKVLEVYWQYEDFKVKSGR